MDHGLVLPAPADGIQHAEHIVFRTHGQGPFQVFLGDDRPASAVGDDLLQIVLQGEQIILYVAASISGFPADPLQDPAAAGLARGHEPFGHEASELVFVQGVEFVNRPACFFDGGLEFLQGPPVALFFIISGGHRLHGCDQNQHTLRDLREIGHQVVRVIRTPFQLFGQLPPGIHKARQIHHPPLRKKAHRLSPGFQGLPAHLRARKGDQVQLSAGRVHEPVDQGPCVMVRQIILFSAQQNQAGDISGLQVPLDADEIMFCAFVCHRDTITYRTGYRTGFLKE